MKKSSVLEHNFIKSIINADNIEERHLVKKKILGQISRTNQVYIISFLILVKNFSVCNATPHNQEN